jgi:hypothetical protein
MTEIITPFPDFPARSSPTFSAEVDIFLRNMVRVTDELNEKLGTPEAANTTLGLVQSGTNSNGRWVRIGGVFQVCWASVTTSSSGAVTWTFPQPFTSGTVQVFGTQSTSDFNISPSARDLTATTATLRAFNSANGLVTQAVRWLAVGLYTP